MRPEPSPFVWRVRAVYLSVLAVCATLGLPGCGATPAPLSAHEPPFTAAQIRAATPEGRRYRYRIEQPGKPPFVQIIEFVEVDAEGATLRQQSIAEAPRGGGPAPEPGMAAEARVTWSALAAHGRRPKETYVALAQTTVPAGTFECLRYTTRKGQVVTRSWFARRLPGAPVRQVVMRGGSRAFRMTLLDHHPPLPAVER